MRTTLSCLPGPDGLIPWDAVAKVFSGVSLWTSDPLLPHLSGTVPMTHAKKTGRRRRRWERIGWSLPLFCSPTCHGLPRGPCRKKEGDFANLSLVCKSIYKRGGGGEGGDTWKLNTKIPDWLVSLGYHRGGCYVGWFFEMPDC